MTSNLDLIRAATFQAQTERLDFRTQGVKKCKPPNRRCGDRCIPPNWDCRLRGEGNDPHLAAVGRGSDPIGGFANLERSVQKLGRAVTKLSASELEASRRAFARGAAKLHPGNLKEKEKAKEDAFKVATMVALPVGIAIFAGLGHRGLKANRQYREGVGKQIDDAVEQTVYNIKRNAPFVGPRVRQQEEAAQNALNTLRQAGTGRLAGGPEAIAARAGRTTFLSSNTRRLANSMSQKDTTGSHAVRRSLWAADRNVNTNAPSRLSYNEWQPKSLQAFWRTKLPTELHGQLTGDGSTSLFAVGATNNLMARAYGIPRDRSEGLNLKTDATRLVKVMSQRLSSSRAALLADMKERGYSIENGLDDYLSLNSRQWRTGDAAIDAETHSYIKRLISAADTSSFAREQYISVRKSFDHYFTQIGTDIAIPPSIDNNTFRPGERAQSFYADGLLGHAEGLARMSSLPWPADRAIRTPEMAELVRRAYHTRVVMGNRSGTVAFSSVNRLKAVALELSGKSGYISTQEAETIVSDFLRTMGFSGVTVPRPNRRDTYADAFQETYARLDKRCGKSAIPDNKKCHVPTYGAATAAPGKRPTSPRAAASPAAPGKKPSDDSDTGSVLKKVAAGAALAGAAAVGVAGFKNRRAIGSAVKTGRQAAGTAVAYARGAKQRYETVKAAKLGEKNSYGGQKHTEQSAARAAREQVVQEYKKYVPYVSEAIATRLSADDVRIGISKLPTQFQEPAKNMVGFAKKYAVTVGLKADDYKMVNVNNEHNFATYRGKDGHIASVGSVGDSVLVYWSQPERPIKGVAQYGMAFRVDQSYNQKKGLAPEESKQIAAATRQMFQEQLNQLPENAFIYNKPYDDDGLGRKRAKAYHRQGFRAIPNSDKMWAMKDQGQFRKMSEEELKAFAALLENREDAADACKSLKSIMSGSKT